MATNKDLEIKQGKTFSLVVRWESEPIIRKPITGISLASGAPRLEVTAHGCPNGWRTAVTMVKGMTQLNARNSPPRTNDYYTATVIDANRVEFNDVTPVDDSGREWPAWTQGGFLQWNTPVDLSGVTVRMKIKDKAGGTVLASTELADAPLNILSFAIDNSSKTIILTISAANTAALTWKKGVFDIEAVDGSGKVTLLVSGNVTVDKEVTT